MGLHKVEHIHKLYFTYLHISYTNFIYTYIHLYTHTHIYIYIYIYMCSWLSLTYFLFNDVTNVLYW